MVGPVVGNTVGTAVGVLVGFRVGALLGVMEGLGDGLDEGDFDSCMEGTVVGNTVGTAVGILDGSGWEYCSVLWKDKETDSTRKTSIAVWKYQWLDVLELLHKPVCMQVYFQLLHMLVFCRFIFCLSSIHWLQCWKNLST